MAQGKGEARKAVGALWKKTSKSGMTFMSGRFDDTEIVIFTNGKKEEQVAEGKNAADFLIYVSEPYDKKPAKGKTTPKADPFGDL